MNRNDYLIATYTSTKNITATQFKLPWAKSNHTTKRHFFFSYAKGISKIAADVDEP